MQSVMQHSFSRAPTLDIQRSSFNRSHGYKTTFDASYLIPIFLDEALPGDTFNLDCSAFARLATPLHPIMDNMYLDIHFFSCPIRQLWTNFRKFMGEQVDPGDSISFVMPKMTFAAAITVGTLFDYLGLPLGMNGAENISALPCRAYNHIYNEWYRDENLINSVVVDVDDGPDNSADYVLLKRGKRHDYFTSCLPWPQKGTAVSLPLGTSAPILLDATTVGTAGTIRNASNHALSGSTTLQAQVTSGDFFGSDAVDKVFDPNGTLYANLAGATASTVNQLLEAFAVQRLLVTDARSGTRYPEILKAHFGVDFYDPSYRPEYLGGLSVPINIHPVPQTSESGTTPQGNLAAFGTVGLSGGGFTKSFTEHCYVMGICSVRADLTYQQGVNRLWSRNTRYDFFWPELANIGEQAVLSQELWFSDADAPGNITVFGYQERYAEYRYKPSQITGLFRSDAPATLDSWHLSQDFAARPTLNQTFIEEDVPIDRVIEVPTEPHFIADFFFNLQCARPMPLYSIPGLASHL